MSSLTPGFASVHEAQSCFRAVLVALSRPGIPVELNTRLTPPGSLSAAAAAILLTLTDSSVAVAIPQADAVVQAWLTFHTNARFSEVGEADFIVCPAEGSSRPKLGALRHGTYDEPESGATLILHAATLAAGRRVCLIGPGIETRLMVNLPLDEAFFAERAILQAQAPCGVDILLCAGQRIFGLPRSTFIEVV
ncbi:MAG: phosphonate C-P lyase system protein PhnH [Rhodospirillales bacterium 20-64-7]|nr:MAG: phosphonate C-P lyase system protein PhnH [Rhodospirillales bacterium 20-64-7]